MLELIDDLPDHVVGVRAVGEVTADDYDTVLEPAIDDRLQRHEKVRFLYVLGPEFTGYEPGAMWEDAKLGLRTVTAYDRIAVITDVDWLRRTVDAFGWLLPADVRVAHVDEIDDAIRWLSD